MPTGPKIATCNYCGTRAALVLDSGRHELTCASCGAPLHDLKQMPSAAGSHSARQAGHHPSQIRTPHDNLAEQLRSPQRPKKKKKRKPGYKAARKATKGLFELLDDLFD